MKKKSAVLILGAMMILSLGLVQVQEKLMQYPPVQMESLLYLPSGRFLKPLALGYDPLLADLLWMKTISYFGGHFMTDKQYPWLYHMLTLIIDLDPHFDFPYYFGGIVLSLEASQVEQANKILEKGTQVYPEKWEFPFYIGFNYFYHKKDALGAIPYIEKASSLPGAPVYLKGLIGSLHQKTGKKEAALAFYREAYQNSTEEMVRQKIKEKIDQILSEKEEDDIGDPDKTSH